MKHLTAALLALVAAACIALPAHAVIPAEQAERTAQKYYADLAQKNEQARQALYEGQYDKAVAVTGEIAQLDENQPLNWYRMAIAGARSGQYKLALRAISAAEALDPALKFASSPAHVERLKAAIRVGLGRAAGHGSGLLDAAVDPAAAAPLNILPVLPAEAPAEISARQLTELSRKVDRLLERPAQVAPVKAPMPDWYERPAVVWAAGFALMLLSALGLVAWSLQSSLRGLRAHKLATAARMPLTRLIQENRDSVGLLMQRLRAHGHGETELYLQLSRALPSLERESGRVQVNLAALTKGKILMDSAGKLEAKPMVLGHNSARAVHEQAARSAVARATSGAAQQACAGPASLAAEARQAA